jgi:hypothetical protein
MIFGAGMNNSSVFIMTAGQKVNVYIYIYVYTPTKDKHHHIFFAE